MSYKKITISTKVFEKADSIVTWIENRPVLVAKYKGKYYGMDAVCAHMGCAILDTVKNGHAICPAHGAEYDVTSGEKVKDAFVKPEAPCEYDESRIPLKTYSVREKEGFLEIDL